MKKTLFIFYKFYKLKFRYPFLISLVGFAILMGFSFEALGDFYVYKKFANRKIELNPTTFHFFLGNVLKREWLRISSPKVKNKSLLPSFYITANGRDIQKLNSNLPESGKSQYITAYMRTDDSTVKKVKMRYRGDNRYHWLYRQKSLRLKLGNNDLYKMGKKLNIINPPHIFTMLEEFINYSLSKKEGLITPDYYPVRVFLNSEYMGVYTYLSQVDESLLRKHKRMPGSIYSGDSAPPGRDHVSMLWRDEKYWEKIGARNAEQSEDRNDIAYLIRAINTFDDTSFYEFFNDKMDKGKFYTFFAMDSVFGSGHHDYHHNHKLYFDPYKGKFEPIQWDMAQWSIRGEKDISYNPLLHRVKLNPILEYERDLAAYNLLNRYSSKFLINELRQLHSLTLYDLKVDIFKDNAKYLGNPFSGWVSVPISNSESVNIIKAVENVLKKRRVFNYKIFDDTSVASNIKTLSNRLKQILFKVNGNSPIKIKLFSWIKKNTNTSGARLYKDINLNGILDKTDKLLTVNDDEQLLFPGRKVVSIKTAAPILLGNIKCENYPLYYSFLIENTIDNIKLSSMTAENAITGNKMKVDHESFLVKNDSDSIHPWSFSIPKNKKKVLSGTIIVDKDLVFDQYTSVEILSGTNFIIHPGKSLFFYGPVNAVGEKDNLIRFIPKDKNLPWGSVVVHGNNESDCVFKYCFFSSGSITEGKLIKYTAQFNIHERENFKISHCTFGPNYIGDDSMHVAYGSGSIQSCTFFNAHSDAIDIDIAKVSIDNCLFLNSGNDSLDFMTSDAVVNNSIFIYSKDKGISTGEWSTASYKNNLFYGCNIALEIKDKSIVNLKNIIIINSGLKAVNLYNKNKRYDEGGTINAPALHIIGGNKQVTADQLSKVNIKRIDNRFPDILEFPFITTRLNNIKSWVNLENEVQRIIKKYED